MTQLKPFNKKFPNIFINNKRQLFTKSNDKNRFFDEKIIIENNQYYREWDPKRSKLAAGLMKGLSQIGFKQGSTVLYLGASHGYTTSFVSDIITNEGFIIAIDIAPTVTRDLVALAEKRKNIAPILADCNHPEEYSKYVEKTDIIFQDIAQKTQVPIFLKNCDSFLKNEGFGLLVVKARSIDVTKKPKEIFKRVRAELEQHITIVDYKELEPFEKDHAIFVVKKKY